MWGQSFETSNDVSKSRPHHNIRNHHYICGNGNEQTIELALTKQERKEQPLLESSSNGDGNAGQRRAPPRPKL